MNSLLIARACLRTRAKLDIVADTLGPVATIDWLILNHGVVAGSAVEQVLARPADQDVVAVAAEERVISVAADQDVVAVRRRPP